MTDKSSFGAVSEGRSYGGGVGGGGGGGISRGGTAGFNSSRMITSFYATQRADMMPGASNTLAASTFFKSQKVTLFWPSV